MKETGNVEPDSSSPQTATTYAVYAVPGCKPDKSKDGELAVSI